MKHLGGVIMLLAATPAFSQSNEPVVQGAEIGRFQISSASCISEKKCVAFGIDTTTGEVFACQYTYTPGIYDFGGQCKPLPHRASADSSSN